MKVLNPTRPQFPIKVNSRQHAEITIERLKKLGYTMIMSLPVRDENYPINIVEKATIIPNYIIWDWDYDTLKNKKSLLIPAKMKIKLGI